MSFEQDRIQHSSEKQTTIEDMEKELIAVGWTTPKVNIWRSPSGLVYSGLYRAWNMMKTHPELNVSPIVNSA